VGLRVGPRRIVLVRVAPPPASRPEDYVLLFCSEPLIDGKSVVTTRQGLAFPLPHAQVQRLVADQARLGTEAK